MRLAVNLGLSLVMLALCVTLVWPHADTRAQLVTMFEHLDLAAMAPELAIYVALLVVMQLARSLRWNDLLAPLGVRVPTGPLLAISAVGFMAIVALPARLGELVRPGLLRRRGVSASAALGTVAVERIVDGLMVSLFVFGAFFWLRHGALRGPSAPRWMMPTAYAALALFAAALAFLICARRWPTETVRWSLKLSLLPRLAPKLASVIETKLHAMIRGFESLADRRHFPIFVVWSAIYWSANGAGVWVLAHAFGLALSPVGAYAVMGLIAVGITLPNSPGMLGQFQAFMLLGLTLYLGPDANTEHTALYARTFAFANTHYVLQLGWYLVCGTIGLLTPWVSVAELRAAQKTGDDVAA